MIESQNHHRKARNDYLVKEIKATKVEIKREMKEVYLEVIEADHIHLIIEEIIDRDHQGEDTQDLHLRGIIDKDHLLDTIDKDHPVDVRDHLQDKITDVDHLLARDTVHVQVHIAIDLILINIGNADEQFVCYI